MRIGYHPEPTWWYDLIHYFGNVVDHVEAHIHRLMKLVADDD